MVGTSNTSSLMWTRVPADNKHKHKALACVRATQAVLCCVAGGVMHSKALSYSNWWRGINRFMMRGGPLYKPGNTHQRRIRPVPLILFSFNLSQHVGGLWVCTCLTRFDTYSLLLLSVFWSVLINTKEGNHQLYFYSKVPTRTTFPEE